MCCNDVRKAMRCVDGAIFQTSLIVSNFFPALALAPYPPQAHSLEETFLLFVVGGRVP
jgi:hypothetical protein